MIFLQKPRLLLCSRPAGRRLFGGGSLSVFHLLFGSFGAFELGGSHQKCESGGGVLSIPGEKNGGGTGVGTVLATWVVFVWNGAERFGDVKT